MSDTNQDATIETRRHERVDLDDRVAIRFDATPVEGSGQNISAQGVFFEAEGSIAVQVEIEGRQRTLPGEIVRIEARGDGKVGIAVKFHESHPDLVD